MFNLFIGLFLGVMIIIAPLSLETNIVAGFVAFCCISTGLYRIQEKKREKHQN